jgi:hypothetical protein
MEPAKDSSEVEWSLVVEGEVIVQSNDIIDCINARDGPEGRITDNA